MKNPSWVRDENILALDLYFREDYDTLSNSHPEVIRISDVLQSLPIHDLSKRTDTFRNSGGVFMKLGNFLHLDPNDPRKGLSSIGKNDREVWDEFHADRGRLRRIAQNIIDISANHSLTEKLYRVPDYEDNESYSVKEGEVSYKLHRFIERDRSIIRKKKQQALKKTGMLECEVCKFDFHKTYGKLGEGFIECHHIIPLKDLEHDTRTKLSDLALVCANCHRMIHKNIDTLSIKALRTIIENNG